jgi:hypothetical protein
MFTDLPDEIVGEILGQVREPMYLLAIASCSKRLSHLVHETNIRWIKVLCGERPFCDKTTDLRPRNLLRAIFRGTTMFLETGLEFVKCYPLDAERALNRICVSPCDANSAMLGTRIFHGATTESAGQQFTVYNCFPGTNYRHEKIDIHAIHIVRDFRGIPRIYWPRPCGHRMSYEKSTFDAIFNKCIYEVIPDRLLSSPRPAPEFVGVDSPYVGPAVLR